MVRWLMMALLVGAFVGAPPGGAAAAATIADFAGRWRGVDVARTDDGGTPSELSPADLGVTIVPDGDGFRMTWTQPDGRPIEVAFAPAAGRPGVFFVRPGGRGLLDLFSSPETGNPLKGERLLWSRLEGDTLVVYNLRLEDDGNFHLNRYAWTLADGGLALEFSRMSQGPTKQTFEGRLERAGA